MVWFRVQNVAKVLEVGKGGIACEGFAKLLRLGFWVGMDFHSLHVCFEDCLSLFSRKGLFSDSSTDLGGRVRLLSASPVPRRTAATTIKGFILQNSFILKSSAAQVADKNRRSSKKKPQNFSIGASPYLFVVLGMANFLSPRHWTHFTNMPHSIN